MGTQGAFVIEDHQGVKHAYVPNPDPKKREGTVYDYFRDNLDATPSDKMLNGQPAPLPVDYQDPEGGLKRMLEGPFARSTQQRA
jgi:hypothetical protein